MKPFSPDWQTLEAWMEPALEQARQAGAAGEVPVGAALLRQGRVLALGRNRRVEGKDPLAHAEIEALRQGARELGSWNLEGCVLAVTLEPCPMCAGAIMQAHLDAVIFGAFDARAGCCGSLYNLPADERFSARCAVFGGVRQEECAELLKNFFSKRRSKDVTGEL